MDILNSTLASAARRAVKQHRWLRCCIEVAAVAVVILWTDFLHFNVFGRSYISEYVLSSNLPLKLAGIEPLRLGRFPAWNSNLAAGWPILADASALPLDWRNTLFLLFDPLPAYWFALFISRLIGATFLFYYLRLRHGMRFSAALPATFVYFCGNLVMEDSRSLGTAVWDLLPAYLWLVEALYDRMTKRLVAAIAALWFFMFTMGSFGAALYVAPVGGLWAFALFMAGPVQDWPRFTRFTAVFCLAHLLGMSLTGVSLLPFLEFVGLSNRGNEYPTDPFALRSIFFGLFGPHDQYNPIFPTFGFFLYVGIVSVPLIVMFRRHCQIVEYREALTWASVFILATILALTTPFKYFVIEYVPLVGTIGVIRLAPFWGFLAAVMVGYGLNASFWNPTTASRLITFLLLSMQASVLVVGAIVGSLWLVVSIESPDRLAALQGILASFANVATPGFIALVALRAAGLFTAMRAGGTGRSRMIGGLLLLEVTATMAIARPSTTVQQYYPVTPEVKFLKDNISGNYDYRMLLSYPFVMRKDWDSYITLLLNAQLVHKLRSANIYNSLIVENYSLLFEAFGDIEERKTRYRRGYNQNMVTNRITSPLLDALAVRFVALAAPPNDTTGLTERLNGENYIVYERHNPMPRAFFVAKAHVADQADIERRLRSIANGDFEQQQLRRYVLLDADSLPKGANVSAYNPDGAPNSSVEHFAPARVTRDRHTLVSVEVEAPSDGWLVLSDTHYPGWTASVKGASLPVVLANGFARAVPVKAGHQRVDFRFKSQSVLWGALLSLVALIVLLILIAAPAFVTKLRMISSCPDGRDVENDLRP